jgi:hypothetical protein
MKKKQERVEEWSKGEKREKERNKINKRKRQ